MTERKPAAVILAAGKGTRMRSRLPKVIHEAAGRPLLDWVLTAARGAGCDRLVVVIGHQAEEVRAAVAADDVEFVVQEEQRGTGHALAMAAPLLAGSSTVLVLSGDVPLVQPATLEALLAGATTGWGAMAVAEVADPGSLGRVISPDGRRLERIVEASDASEEELDIGLINAGIYALPAPEIFELLGRLEPDNAKGEFYLTDALGAAVAAGEEVTLVPLADLAEALGANDRRDLARIHRAFIGRKLDELADAGVTVLDPARTVVEPQVEIGPDTVLHPGVTITGASRVGAGSTLQQGVWLRDTRVADGVTLEPYCVLDGADVGPDCRVGPHARLRPGSRLERGAKVGNFVEIKNATLGAGAKAGHLAYIGDADVGAGANIGAGTVTCNYDGVDKHRTTVGEGAFIGSDTMLVAPVEVGAGATTAAGSVINHDVPPGALGVGRAKQRTVEGWAARRRKKSES